MNAFGEALNLVFMRGSDALVPIRVQWTQSQTAFPWVQVPTRGQWISDCIPMSSYLPANGLKTQDAFPWVQVPVRCLWTQSQTAFPWVQVSTPSQWISDCIPMSPYSQPMNLRLHSHESLSPCQIFGVYWLGITHVRPSCFRNAPRIPSVASRTRFWVYPLQSHMDTHKIDCRAF